MKRSGIRFEHLEVDDKGQRLQIINAGIKKRTADITAPGRSRETTRSRQERGRGGMSGGGWESASGKVCRRGGGGNSCRTEGGGTPEEVFSRRRKREEIVARNSSALLVGKPRDRLKQILKSGFQENIP